jgi:hypothetical protein
VQGQNAELVPFRVYDPHLRSSNSPVYPDFLLITPNASS